MLPPRPPPPSGFPPAGMMAAPPHYQHQLMIGPPVSQNLGSMLSSTPHTGGGSLDSIVGTLARQVVRCNKSGHVDANASKNKYIWVADGKTVSLEALG